jgi:hypothetical protein
MPPAALNPFVQRNRPQPILIDMTPLTGALIDIRPISIQQVRRTSDEPLFNSLIEHHHYLGYEQPVGEHLKYLAWAQGRPSHAWPGVRRPVTWAAATATSTGLRKRGGATSASLLTTRGF